VVIINSLVRIYALSAQLSMPSTLSRLANLPEDSGLTKRDADNLRDIWLFLNRLRWRHQVSNKVTDNSILITDLSAIEKHQLKAAFQAIQVAQQGALLKFCGEMS
jgi:CBS domain-containing protein